MSDEIQGTIERLMAAFPDIANRLDWEEATRKESAFTPGSNPTAIAWEWLELAEQRRLSVVMDPANGLRVKPIFGKLALDRSYQRELLETLAESYPGSYDHRDLFKGMNHLAERKYAANLQYLADHGLAESSISIGIDGHMSFGLPRITHKGLDFLADDGGLSAILNTVTIKFEAKQLAELLAARVEALSSGTVEEKSSIAKAIRLLPAKALETLSTKLLEWGIDRTPDAIHTMQHLLSQITM